MIQFIPMLILAGLFAAIGIYWVFMAQHFMEWTTRSNLNFRRVIDNHLPQPILVERTYASINRMQSNGTMDLFLWSVRFLGSVLAFFAIFTFSFLISSFL
jgi:hypothetical protein